MKGFISGLVVAAMVASGYPATVSASPARSAVQLTPVVSDWVFNGQANADCQLQSEGAVTDVSGAGLSMSCEPDVQVLGNVLARLSAQSWRHRRITISAEIKVSEAMSASLWLKTQHETTTLMFDDDTEQNLLRATQLADGWVQRSITLPVAWDATQISFGVLLSGNGELALREVRLSVSEPGMIAPQAAQLLDAAIDIVKQQTLQRNDLAWQVLEPQLRLFTSGAQTTAEVYPAIKYLLSRLDDRQSLLLTPEVALAMSGGVDTVAADAGNVHVNIFALPDGARLVLSRSPAERVIRTAQNLSQPVALP